MERFVPFIVSVCPEARLVDEVPLIVGSAALAWLTNATVTVVSAVRVKLQVV